MKLKNNILKSAAFAPVLWILSVVGAILFYAGRVSWVFVNIALNIKGFTMFVFCLMILNSIHLMALSAARLYNLKLKEEVFWQKKIFSVLSLAAMGFTALFFVFGVVFAIVMSIEESSGVYLLYLEKSLFKAAFFVLVPFFAVFVPALGKKTRKAVTAVTLVAVMLVGFFQLFPLNTYKMTSVPMVIDNGEGYSVVFATNDTGTGYVEYEYNGQSYKIFDETNGKLDCETKIHTVFVPYDHLENNTYTVGSQRVIEQYSYGSRTGKEIKSIEYKFVVNEAPDQTYLVLSDWHTELDKAYDAIKHVGEYDAVILLGDASPGIDFEEEVIRNIVEFGGTVSKGTKPVIFARGNHETRGAYADNLSEALGMENFYYKTNIGPYSFIVLDSGEDKIDSHLEYGGLNVFEKSRSEMVNWLSQLGGSTGKTIALSHDWKISNVEKDLSEAAWHHLETYRVSLMLSGHSHECRLVGEGDEDEKAFAAAHPGIVGYMVGGMNEKTFVATKMTLSDETVKLEAFDNKGSKVFDKAFLW